MNPPRGFGGVNIPPKDVPAAIDQLQYEIECLSRKNEELETRIMELEENQRPSRLDADFERRVTDAIERGKSSRPPESHAEVKTASGYRLHAPTWAFLLALVLMLAIVAVWRVGDIAGIVK